ncbi:MAG: DNA polymerase III subunit delta [Microthrixaceae bacterium]
MSSGRIQLLKGSDPTVLAGAARDAVSAAVGDAPRAEVLDEFAGDDYDLQAVVLAATTVSMFGDRVVVARNLARFPSAELGPLLDLLADPPPDTSLVLVWDKPTSPNLKAYPVPKKVADALKEAGGTVTDTSPPSGRALEGWLADRFDAAPVQLGPAARRLVVERLGEDVARLGELFVTLEGVHGTGAGPLGPDDVEAYLGDAGGVPPWDLTDAIDSGDAGRAVALARRMTAGGGRHPLQVMATLSTHVERMLRLDGAGVADERAAAALLGMKGSTFPAKKALQQGRSMGPERLTRAAVLLAEADLDLRGRTGTPPEQVLEVLVGRLARLSPGRGRAGRSGPARRR